MDLVAQIRKAYKVSTPLVSIATADTGPAIEKLVAGVFKNAPVVTWDIARGLLGYNEEGKALARQLIGSPENQPASCDPVWSLNALYMNENLIPDGAAILFHNGHRLLETLQVIQALQNLRDRFKVKQVMLALFGPHMVLPPELVFSIVTFEEPLPTEEERKQIICSIHVSGEVELPSPERLQLEADATPGLAPFMVEQQAALALTREGIILDDLRDFQRKVIRQTKGLEIDRSNLRYGDVGGVAQVKEFLRGLVYGEEPPSCFIFMDEIEKMLGGTGTAEAGAVDRDQLNMVLREMNDNEWNGIIAVGPPGCTKSMIAKASGGEFDRPTIQMDLGAAKNMYVGSSEQAVRQLFQIIRNVAGKRAYFIATCNRLESLPPELMRRFADGTWFFDLPTGEELPQIWDVNVNRFNLERDQPLPQGTPYTGADVRNMCSIARRRRCTLMEASRYIVPVAVASPESIEGLRKLANGRFLSASYPGFYEFKTQAQQASTSHRKLQVD